MEGSDDHCLFVSPGWISWSIGSSLKAEKVYCPAHPRNASNLREGSKEWKFNKADDKGVDSEDWEEGGVVIHCSVHTK